MSWHVRSEEAIPIDDLEPMYAPWRDGHGKAFGIIKSSSALVSNFSSSLLIWMILRSSKRLSTTQHRILFGISVSDILYSISHAHFNALAPSEVDYLIWNARGNQASCSGIGFVGLVGLCGSLLYSCSLNLYYLAVVKFGASDSYIRTKIEPFLHGVPIAIAMITSITFLMKENINSANASRGGDCIWPTYEPPHCIGYENGEVREGFSIPCGRGYDGAVTFWTIMFFAYFFVVPIIIGVPLGLMFRSVSKNERRMARYGTGSLNVGNCERKRGGIVSVTGTLRRLSSREQSNSQRILSQAMAYSSAYLLTWSWIIVIGVIGETGVNSPLWLVYLSSIFSPLQGFFNFAVFLHPKAVNAKKSQDIELSWCEAIGEVIFPGRKWWGGKKSTVSNLPQTQLSPEATNPANNQSLGAPDSSNSEDLTQATDIMLTPQELSETGRVKEDEGLVTMNQGGSLPITDDIDQTAESDEGKAGVEEDSNVCTEVSLGMYRSSMNMYSEQNV